MTSKGPCSSRRSLSSRSRTIVAASISSTPRRTWTLRNPSWLRPPQRPAQLVALAADDVRAEVAVGAPALRSMQHPLGDVEHDGDREHVVRLGERRRRRLRASGWTLVASTTVSRPARQPLARRCVQHVEGVLGGGLVVLVVGDQAAAEVAGDHLEGPEVLGGEGRLAGPGDADEDDEGQLGDRGSAAVMRGGPSCAVKTAIWVGGPTSGSSSPTGAYRTRSRARGDRVGPGRELGPGPLEAVVGVAQPARRQARR